MKESTYDGVSPSKSYIMPTLSPFKQNFDQIENKLNHDNLKSAIRALNEKLKFYENIDTEKNIVKEQFEHSD
jgi:hypothetical protein